MTRYFYKHQHELDLGSLEGNSVISNPTGGVAAMSAKPIKHRKKRIQKEEANNHIMLPYINSIEITNFKSIKKVKFKLQSNISSKSVFTLEDNDLFLESLASWTVILGNNGVGKSTILEAIALALVGASKAVELFPPKAAKKFIRRGSSTCSVKLEFADGTKSKLKIQKTKGIIFEEGKEEKNILIRAYGHVRLIPKDKINKQPQRVEIDNLYDPHFQLCNVNEFFLNLSEEPTEHIEISPFTFAVQTLRDIIPEMDTDEIKKIDDETIELSIAGKKLFLEELSSGYQSVLVLAADIMSSLKNNLTNMQNEPGIVLLDEIGSQLHPSWRMRIVRDLRKAFPKIQFIATTHEPLCLKGIATEEIIKIDRDGAQQLDKTIHPDVSKLRVDQLLTSPLFGLESTIDPSVDKKFKEYYELLVNENENTDKIIKLKGELAKYNTLGHTRRDQLLYDIIDKYVAENPTTVNKIEIDEDLKKKVIETWTYAKGRNQI